MREGLPEKGPVGRGRRLGKKAKENPIEGKQEPPKGFFFFALPEFYKNRKFISHCFGILGAGKNKRKEEKEENQ
ncbi:MAG: hypothetical protein IJF41_06180 [Clostridia bacterium]|nr:hypothetical protein [Clostridia bacterium]